MSAENDGHTWCRGGPSKQFVRSFVTGAHDWLAAAGYDDAVAWDAAVSLVKAQFRAEADWRCSDQLAVDFEILDSIREDYR